MTTPDELRLIEILDQVEATLDSVVDEERVVKARRGQEIHGRLREAAKLVHAMGDSAREDLRNRADALVDRTLVEIFGFDPKDRVPHSTT